MKKKVVKNYGIKVYGSEIQREQAVERLKEKGYNYFAYFMV